MPPQPWIPALVYLSRNYRGFIADHGKVKKPMESTQIVFIELLRSFLHMPSRQAARRWESARTALGHEAILA
jgi:hypothetical protein